MLPKDGSNLGAIKDAVCGVTQTAPPGDSSSKLANYSWDQTFINFHRLDDGGAAFR